MQNTQETSRSPNELKIGIAAAGVMHTGKTSSTSTRAFAW